MTKKTRETVRRAPGRGRAWLATELNRRSAAARKQRREESGAEANEEGRSPPTGRRFPAEGIARTTQAEAKDTNARKARKNIRQFKFWIVAGPEPDDEGSGYESPRTRAAKLRARMLQFHRIYNAAWMVRYAQFGRADYRQEKIDKFVAVLKKELEQCDDTEALIYAVADALTAYPRGCPWEA